MATPLPARSIIDTHTHTHFSDGAGTFEANVAAASAAGCRVLVATDHLTLPATLDPTSEVCVAERELPAHRTAFKAARDAHPELEVIYGFECDWYEGCEKNIPAWSAGAQVRLGSVHWLGTPEAGDWIDNDEDLSIWAALGPDEVWRRYVETWCRACACPLFNTMAHPDLAMRFANEGYAPTIDLAPLWDEMACCAHDLGVRVELSTAGLRKSVRDYYPAQGLLERFYHAEVPLTVGSDAHTPADVCWGIAQAYDHAACIGYRSIEVPRADGSWEAMAIV